MVRFEDVKNDGAVRTYIKAADESLAALGYTEHSFAHVGSVANTAANILECLGFDERRVEIAKIAGYLHDIGNLVNRTDHSQSGAIMAFRILDKMGMDAEELVKIVAAIGNHDEGDGVAVNPLAAALIISDKSDVRRTRVRNRDFTTFDIHDRVNYSVSASELKISEDKKEISLELSIDTEYSSVTDYFEIFLARMLLCRKAAEILGMKFRLIINGQKLM